MAEGREKSWSQGMEELFQGLADRTRLRILKILYVEGEVCVGDLVQVIGTNQPKISRHLAYLRRRRLVGFSKQGLVVRYWLSWPDDEEKAVLVKGLLASGAHSFETREDLRKLEAVRRQLPSSEAETPMVRDSSKRLEGNREEVYQASEDIQIELL